MKKFLLTLFLFAFSCAILSAKDEVFYTFQTAYSTNNTAYASTYDVTIDGLNWNVPGNQKNEGFVRIGGKSINAVDRVITGNSQMSKAISKIAVNHNGITNSDFTVNSVTLVVSDDSEYTNTTSVVLNPSFSVSTEDSFEFTGTWAANKYYKFIFNVTNTNTKNQGVDIKSIVFYTPVDVKTLESISATTPTKMVYVQGEALDLTGCVVTATYDDKSEADVTSSATFSPENGSILETIGAQTVTVSYGGKETSFNVTVGEPTIVATPVISCSENMVTISCLTDDAVIQYGFAEDAINQNYSGPFAITENKTIYAKATKDGLTDSAVASQAVTYEEIVSVAGDYKLITDANDFAVGGYYIIANGTTGNVKAIKSGALSSGKLQSTDLTISNDKATITDPTDVAVFTVETVGESNYLKYVADGKYLAYSGNSTNFSIGSSVSDNGKLTCTIAAADNSATIKLGGSRYIASYSSGSSFRAYTSGGEPVYIFKKLKPAAEAPSFITDPANTIDLVDGKATVSINVPDGVTVKYTVNGGTEQTYVDGIKFTEQGSYVIEAWSEAPEKLDSEHIKATFGINDPNAFGPLTVDKVEGTYDNGTVINVNCPNAVKWVVTFCGEDVEVNDNAESFTVTLQYKDKVTDYVLCIMVEDKDKKIAEITNTYHITTPGAIAFDKEVVNDEISILRGEPIVITCEGADRIDYEIDYGSKTVEDSVNLDLETTSVTITPENECTISVTGYYKNAPNSGTIVGIDYISQAQLTKVTSASELVVGGSYVFVGVQSGTKYFVSNVVNNGGYIEANECTHLTIDETVLNVDNSVQMSPMVYGKNNTFKMGEKYLSANDQNFSLTDNLTDLNNFTVSFETGKFSIKTSGDKTVYFNASSPRFKPYVNAQSDLSIYRVGPHFSLAPTAFVHSADRSATFECNIVHKKSGNVKRYIVWLELEKDAAAGGGASSVRARVPAENAGSVTVDAGDLTPGTHPVSIPITLNPSQTYKLVAKAEAELNDGSVVSYTYPDTMTVDMTKEEGTTGVETVVAEDEAGEVEYYNLQGVKVDGENLTRGVYIRRQGNTAVKVVR